MKLIIAITFILLGWSAYSRSSVTRQVSASELLSSQNSGVYTLQGTVSSISENGIVFRGLDGAEVRAFGQNDKLSPGASGTLTIQRTGDQLSISKFNPSAGQSQSGQLLGLRYDQASNKMYGNVDKLGWVNVNKANGIYAVQE